MPATDSPAILVARFLKANNYDETLDAFIKEAGLPLDAGTQQPGDLTIEKVLQEKKIFDLSLNFEKVGLDSSSDKWTVQAPSIPTSTDTLLTASNLLYVSLDQVQISSGNTPEHLAQYIFATSADRQLSMIKPVPGDFSLLSTSNQIHDSPILSCVIVHNRWLISTSMSGQVVLFDCLTQKTLETRRDHTKYVVKATAWEDERGAWVATIGWDSKVFLYRMSKTLIPDYDDSIDVPISLGSPVSSTSLPSNPEHVQFIRHPDSEEKPILLLSRRDSTFLYYYAIPPLGPLTAEQGQGQGQLILLGKQNLAPHSNAWIAFTPSSVAICPTDDALVAVGTSSVPHMKLLIARLLLPKLLSDTLEDTADSTESTQTVQPAHQSHAAQARAELALQDREDAAILTHTSTMAPQTPYSTPQVCWRPDGSGVWVNGDDGVIRGIEAKTGKIVSNLKGGHEPGSKVRSIWAGWVDVSGSKEEWLVSGGFDRKLVVWRAAETGPL